MTTLFHVSPRGSAAASRAWRGAAILSRGFRPFFLAAGVWALVGMALWPFAFTGAVAIPTAFSAVDWHAHKMIFGYVGAVVAGFLLTAIPNWTGRLPVAGVPLAALAALWAAGRIAVFASALIGRTSAAAIDASFLIVFAALVAREVAAGQNWRNLKVAGLRGPSDKEGHGLFDVDEDIWSELLSATDPNGNVLTVDEVRRLVAAHRAGG